tara:strand:+ start:657 stop:1358 length:702 start_codon:yes stop_codon:yes gene_type:complete
MGSEPRLAVNEIFGPTFQGEGVNLGVPCVFLRLAGCNLSCEWCDTAYTWDWSRYSKDDEIDVMTIAKTYDAIRTVAGPLIRHLVISGGEPMLQQRGLALLGEHLRHDGWFTEIETAGTVMPDSSSLVNHFTVSPKLSNSGNSERKRYRPDVLKTLNGYDSTCFKFVVSDLKDFEEIDDIVTSLHLKNIFVMPEGIDSGVLKKRLEVLADAALERNYRLTPRLHVLIYGNRRAV